MAETERASLGGSESVSPAIYICMYVCTYVQYIELSVACAIHTVEVTKNLTFRIVFTSLHNVFTEFCNANTNRV